MKTDSADGAQRNKRKHGFEKISHALSYRGHSKKLDESFWKYKALKSWDKAASNYFEEAAELSKATDLKNGVLFVACLSQDLSRKLKLFSQKIIELLNQLLGRKMVFALVIED